MSALNRRRLAWCAGSSRVHVVEAHAEARALCGAEVIAWARDVDVAQAGPCRECQR